MGSGATWQRAALFVCSDERTRWSIVQSFGVSRSCGLLAPVATSVAGLPLFVVWTRQKAPTARARHLSFPLPAWLTGHNFRTAQFNEGVKLARRTGTAFRCLIYMNNRIPGSKPWQPLAERQLWKMGHAYIRITALGKSLVRYETIKRRGSSPRGASTHMSAIETLESYLKTNDAHLVKSGSFG
jgi:hypothetical protein